MLKYFLFFTLQFVSFSITALLGAYLIEAMKIMVPWLIFVVIAVIVDLICGVRKSILLGKHISLSKALRDTMGKIVVYVAFVILVCAFDVVEHVSGVIAKWVCALIGCIEICSVIANILEPIGIKISLLDFLRLYFHMSPLESDKEDSMHILLAIDKLEKNNKKRKEKTQD